VTAAPPPGPSDRILLVVAHTDDEVIAAGGYLAVAHEGGSAIRIAILTNGDANRLSAAVIAHRIRPTPEAFIREGALRQQESISALGRLGITPMQVVFLGFPDRGLAMLAAPHWAKSAPYTSPFTGVSTPPYTGVFRPSARYTGEHLTESLSDIITEFRPTVLLTHSALDRHPDHRATAEFVTRALNRWAQTAAGPVKRFGFLIHADDFPRPLRYDPHAALRPPPALREEARWITFPLPPSTVLLKGEAMRFYRTQYQSPYLRLLLNGFIRSNELFIEEPAVDGA
jgi:LmbE family N-acetylglucosaminyl deacetylase